MAFASPTRARARVTRVTDARAYAKGDRVESRRRVSNLGDRARRSGQSHYQLSPAAYTVPWHS